jgi:hypothetical protein
MSADNGIVVCAFPNGEFRVAHIFLSLWDEIGTHWLSQEEEIEVVADIFATSPVFKDENEALNFAWALAKRETFLEYGVFSDSLDTNVGELPPKRNKPD